MPLNKDGTVTFKVDVPEKTHRKVKVVSVNLCKTMTFTSNVVLRKIEYRYRDLL